MELDALRLFVEVSRRGSFAAVARDRDTDPSTVSRAVAGLEDGLGLRLFQRSTRRMALTEAGHLYLARIEPLVEELDRARDEALTISSGPVGTLRLTASVAFGQTCLLPLLPGFRAAYPRLRLELLLTDANLDLVADRIDLAIRLGIRPEIDGIGAKLVDTRYRVCASPAYLERSAPLRRPEDLREHRCLLFALPAYRSRWLFRNGTGSVAAVPVAGDLVISNAVALRACALDGLGPALLPDWLVADDLARGGLVALFPDLDATATTFETAAWLLYPSRAYLPTKVRATIAFLKEQIRRSSGAAPDG